MNELKKRYLRIRGYNSEKDEELLEVLYYDCNNTREKQIEKAKKRVKFYYNTQQWKSVSVHEHIYSINP